MRLWDKGRPLDEEVLDFTVGDDHLLDLRLIKYDCLASLAHARMLHALDILKRDELDKISEALSEIRMLVDEGKFTILREEEDGHTAIENYLVEKCGDAGKKIHLGRSRNDQVLTALRMYEKDVLRQIKLSLRRFIEAVQKKVMASGGIPIPGYTHMRKAMPSSVGLWLESFEDAVKDDFRLLATIMKIIDQSPLGTAAGYGVPVFKIDRASTAKELGFSKILENPLYAQFSRGKFEMMILSFCTGLMSVLNKLATDLLLFSMEEFGFLSLPEEFCTGSSIMPHKKNPDVLELIRAQYAVVLGEEIKVKTLVSGLMSGYNRDVQLTKKPLIQTCDTTHKSIEIMAKVLSALIFDEARCRSAMHEELYATEEVYKLVKEGMPFRDAYRKVAAKYS